VVAAAGQQQYFYRKEIFFFAGLALCGVIVFGVQRLRSRQFRKLAAYSTAVFLFVVSVVLALIHEIFPFLAAPAFAFLLYATIRSAHPQSGRSASAARHWTCAFFVLHAVIFLSMLLVFRTTEANAAGIWAHLCPTDRIAISVSGSMDGGIENLSLGASKVFPLLFQVLNTGTAWFYLAPLMLLMLYSLALVAFNEDPNESLQPRSPSWTLCYISLVAFALPEFMLGWDWGRWLSGITTSFLVVWLAVDAQNLLVTDNFILSSRFINRPKVQAWGRRMSAASRSYSRIVQTHKTAALLLLLLFAATFRLPELYLAEAPGDLTSIALQMLKSLAHDRHTLWGAIKYESAIDWGGVVQSAAGISAN
jgi:hypothetical protein